MKWNIRIYRYTYDGLLWKWCHGIKMNHIISSCRWNNLILKYEKWITLKYIFVHLYMYLFVHCIYVYVYPNISYCGSVCYSEVLRREILCGHCILTMLSTEENFELNSKEEKKVFFLILNIISFFLLWIYLHFYLHRVHVIHILAFQLLDESLILKTKFLKKVVD